jgi:hypothetical protein
MCSTVAPATSIIRTSYDHVRIGAYWGHARTARCIASHALHNPLWPPHQTPTLNCNEHQAHPQNRITYLTHFTDSFTKTTLILLVMGWGISDLFVHC